MQKSGRLLHTPTHSYTFSAIWPLPFPCSLSRLLVSGVHKKWNARGMQWLHRFGLCISFTHYPLLSRNTQQNRHHLTLMTVAWLLSIQRRRDMGHCQVDGCPHSLPARPLPAEYLPNSSLAVELNANITAKWTVLRGGRAPRLRSSWRTSPWPPTGTLGRR